MIVLDTSAVLGLEDRRDRRHPAAVAALDDEAGPAILPVGVLAEVDHMVGIRMGAGAMDRVLAGIIDGSLLLDCGDVDPPRIRELMDRYRDLGLGLADAAVIACAERHGSRVMTFDRRDFEAVAGEGLIDLVP